MMMSDKAYVVNLLWNSQTDTERMNVVVVAIAVPLMTIHQAVWHIQSQHQIRVCLLHLHLAAAKLLWRTIIDDKLYCLV